MCGSVLLAFIISHLCDCSIRLAVVLVFHTVSAMPQLNHFVLYGTSMSEIG